MVKGVNQAFLQGQIFWPEFRTLDSGTNLFKAKLKIPMEDNSGTIRDSYVRIAAWQDLASGMNDLGGGAWVKVSGHIQERPYTNKQGQKLTWTEVIVDNFVALQEYSENA